MLWGTQEATCFGGPHPRSCHLPMRKAESGCVLSLVPLWALSSRPGEPSEVSLVLWGCYENTERAILKLSCPTPHRKSSHFSFFERFTKVLLGKLRCAAGSLPRGQRASTEGVVTRACELPAALFWCGEAEAWGGKGLAQVRAGTADPEY